MKIKCIIIDDEPLAAEVIETHLKEFPNMELQRKFTNPLEALSVIETGDDRCCFYRYKYAKNEWFGFYKESRQITLFRYHNCL